VNEKNNANLFAEFMVCVLKLHRERDNAGLPLHATALYYNATIELSTLN